MWNEDGTLSERGRYIYIYICIMLKWGMEDIRVIRVIGILWLLRLLGLLRL